MHTLTFILIHTTLSYASAKLTPPRKYSHNTAPIADTDRMIINAIRVLTPIYLLTCILTGEAALPAALTGYTLLTLSFILTTASQRSNPFSAPVLYIPRVICTTGPYSYIRHPIYLSALTYYSSINLIFQSLYALIPLTSILLLIVLRAHKEDRTLERESLTYKGYRLLVPGMFIPRKSRL